MTATSEEEVAGTTAAGTGVEAGAAHRSAGAEATSDIGQAEAYIVNLKRAVANELDYDQALRRISVQDAQNASDSANRVRVIAEQLLANTVHGCNAQNSSQTENLRHLLDLLNPPGSNVFSDAIAAEVAKAVGTEGE